MSSFEDSRSKVPNYYGTQEGTPFTPGDKSSKQRGDGLQNSPQLSQLQGQDFDGSDRNRDYNDRSREFSNERGSDAFNTERPLNTQPAPEGESYIYRGCFFFKISLCLGGVARDGREALPEGRPGFGDKLVGKTEKVGNLSDTGFSTLLTVYKGHWEVH